MMVMFSQNKLSDILEKLQTKTLSIPVVNT